MNTPTEVNETISDTKVASVQLELDTEKPKQITLANRELFEIKTPDGQISDEGQSEILHYLGTNGLPLLPSDFDWVWIGKRGTFPKRVQAFYYREHKLKLTEVQISELGNKARAHTSLGETYICDFTNRFDWCSGDFGDGGSCFWGDRSGAREMLENNGAYAVRAYRRKNCGCCESPTSPCTDETVDYSNVRGYARAWLVPIGLNRFILFNGYGESALKFARLLALKWNCSYKKIELYNNGEGDGQLYINGSNYLIGAHDEIAPIEKHDFGWEEIQSDHEYVCPCCGENYDAENDGIYCAQEERTVCESCAIRCVDCEEYFTRYIRSRSEYDYNDICNSCYEARLDREREEAREEEEAQSESEVIA